MPLFSIITVTLNPPAEDLQKTLESILDQGFEDWELIVKDGGSDAGVLNNVPDDPRIRVFVQEDTGIFDAMNQSLGYADGGFICFLNAGDTFFDTSALQTVADAYKAHSGSHFFYGDVAKPLSRSGFERYPKRLSRAYLFFHMICHQVWFVSRSYYERSHGYEIEGPGGKNPSGSDYRFLLRMVLVDNTIHYHVPKVLVSYQGGGYSEDPEALEEAEVWKDQQRDSLYGRAERLVYRNAWKIRNLVKALVYDRGLWRVWRRLNTKRMG
jgi:glycosyltransferase involved in cell wall biosynthesis